MTWSDGKCRCRWANPGNPRYIRYHDEEWGVPVHDDRRLFEMLILEGFQAGLSWECVLNKQEAFRRAFDDFDWDKVAAYDEARQAALYADPGIIRNRRKMAVHALVARLVAAAVGNAAVFAAIRQEFGSFDSYLWQWTGGKTLVERGPTTSPLSDAISKDLKKRGMKFVGSTIIYAYLQAVGVLYAHEPGCFLEKKCP